MRQSLSRESSQNQQEDGGAEATLPDMAAAGASEVFLFYSDLNEKGRQKVLAPEQA